jgi:hypothetical protein
MVKLSPYYNHEDVVRMHLHSRPNLEADIRAFSVARHLRAQVPAVLATGIATGQTIATVLGSFSVEAIHGYSVCINEGQLARLETLLASADIEIRIEACYALIDYASILASTSSLERCFDARDIFVGIMTQLELPVALDLAS